MSRRPRACDNGSVITVIMKRTDLVTVTSTHGTSICVRMVCHSALDKRPVPLGWSAIGASPGCDAAEDGSIHGVLPYPRKKAPEFIHGDELRSGDFRSSLRFKCDRLKSVSL
jgi:hypothetical protein